MFDKLFNQFKELFIYGIFGVLTTIVNICVYTLCANQLFLHYLVANVIAWVIAVIFAFITNKLFVFKSKSWERKIWINEFTKFIGARIVTGVLDMLMMYVMIDMLVLNDVFSKIIVNIIVILVNFVFSKLIIFKKTKKDDGL